MGGGGLGAHGRAGTPAGGSGHGHRLSAHTPPAQPRTPRLAAFPLPHPQEDAGEQRFIWGSKFRTADMVARVRRFITTYYDPERAAAATVAVGAPGQPTYMQLLREVRRPLGPW